MANEFYITQKGLDELKEKLNILKVVKRPEASERIKQAREYGDLSENAEYDAAKDEQAMIEAEIKKMEAQIENAVVIEEVQGGKTVTIGCTVMLLDLTYDEEEEWTIVGTSEASFSEHKLSNDSPLAKAIIGKKKGSVAEVTDVAEPYKVKIVDIK